MNTPHKNSDSSWKAHAISFLLLTAMSTNLIAADTPAAPPASSEFSCPAGLSPTTPTGTAPSQMLDATAPRKRDRSCFVAPDVIAKQSKSSSVTLVDVRPAEDFERFRIPGS